MKMKSLPQPNYHKVSIFGDCPTGVKPVEVGLVYVNHPILYQKSRPVQPGTLEFDYLCSIEQEIAEFADRHDGVGIAASQLGDDRAWIWTRFQGLVFNPSYTSTLPPKIKQSREGCLTINTTIVNGEDPSWLKDRYRVKRYYTIVGSYLNTAGQKLGKRMKGYEAYVFQHETDHTNGKNIWGNPPEDQL
jgi:peptide deformylase